VTCGNQFSVGNPTIKKKWLEFISQHKKNYAFAIFNQFIVSLSAPALTHSVSTTFIEYRCQPPGGGGGGSHPSCSAKLNLLCKNRPKRKSWKKPWHYRLNFDPDKNFITAWKSITKLVIFQSFVAKCCKMRII
jgi:hypothetical protein